MRRGWEGCSGPSDPAGVTLPPPPPGDLGAVAAPLPRAQPRGINTRRDTWQPTQGSLRNLEKKRKKKKSKAGSRPRSSDAATKRREAFRRAEQTWRSARAALPAGPAPRDAPGRDARRPGGPWRAVPGGEGRAGRGLCKVAAPPVVGLRVGLGSLFLRLLPEVRAQMGCDFREPFGLVYKSASPRQSQPLLELPFSRGCCVAALVEKSLPCVKKRVLMALPTVTGKRGCFGSCPCPALQPLRNPR